MQAELPLVGTEVSWQNSLHAGSHDGRQL